MRDSARTVSTRNAARSTTAGHRTKTALFPSTPTSQYDRDTIDRRDLLASGLKSQITGMLRVVVIGAISIALTGCVGGPFAPSSGDLGAARKACNQHYPRRVGNYLPHAACVNDAVERLAIPTARYPDLVRLQENARALLSEKIDRRMISAQIGERKMAQADAGVAQAERDRDIGDEASARQRIGTINSILRQ
jgi:hypothetical protein